MYTVSSSPHIKSNDSVQGIMRDVIIALIPATFAGIYFFGMKALLVTLVSVLSCIAAEALWQKLAHRKITIGDLSAVVTGLLLAFNMPAAVPLWLPVIGGFFAIIIVKQFFGGIGQNIMNPALAARAFLFSSWPVHMTNFTVDGVSSATALAILKSGEGELPSLFNIFIGNVGGCIGETSVIALLIGAAYLLYKRVISWHTPVAYIGSVFILTLILGRDGFMNADALYEVCAGGLVLGAFFMATDYSTSPMTRKGQLIFGVGCGLLTTIIRLYGGYAEGVSYAILLMSLAVPFIDKFTAPRIFGEVK
jgi:electron transport complex protein RnfD